MFAVYETFDKQPSRRPESYWKGWTIANGEIVEVRLHEVCFLEREAKTFTQRRQQRTPNTVYYQPLSDR